MRNVYYDNNKNHMSLKTNPKREMLIQSCFGLCHSLFSKYITPTTITIIRDPEEFKEARQ